MEPGFLGLALSILLALVLLVGALLKAGAPAARHAALGTFGIHGERLTGVLWAALVATEVALSVGVVAGAEEAAVLAAVLMAAFALAQGLALRRGRAGAPCGCFGPRSSVGWTGIIRNACLAGGFAALPLLPREEPGTDGWLALGLALALLGCAALAVAVLALAREVGMLRLRLGPESALEIAGEGPELGSRSGLIHAFEPGARAELALAIFVSDGCHMCRALEPAMEALGRDPLLALEQFEEVADAAAWADLDVPGSPYAVVLDLDGTVLAKGTFNSLGQLESVVATAERRRRTATEAAHA